MGDPRRSDEQVTEQVILYVMIAVIGMIPVVIVMAQRGVFGADATVGLLMLATAIAGLLAMWRLERKRRAH